MVTMIEEGKICWSQVMRDFDSSKLTQRKFCEVKRISFAKFKYHRYQMSLKTKMLPKKSQPLFASVKLKQASPPKSNMSIKLSLPNGINCEVPVSCDKSDLLEFIKVLYTCG